MTAILNCILFLFLFVVFIVLGMTLLAFATVVPLETGIFVLIVLLIMRMIR